ncbi:putative short chain dehydrogenase/reductase [Lasiosphaeria miniovina]|uniref:Short chain dehydrogenase/reductase n=1 Tax=Lasiosphaeria miniovina TaxID=1954250 RepID=A0AA40AL24_9PEZI|nr:putative short chain dehydrogenase/reductase [Lasiosphaeria miniovina]KAK0717818.1 putative short chain dehydrogenase/reductase [Lasiosphaeria miniovina]
MASDKTVILITGANGGIGLEAVVALAQASACLHILLGARSLEKGQKALDEIRSSPSLPGGELKSAISVVQIEVTDQASILAARDHVAATFARLDVLVNNAGIIVIKPEYDTLADARETFETNVFGPLAVTEAFEPLLRKSSSPRVVHVSSEQGSVSLRLDPAYPSVNVRGDTYRMSKAALNMLAACHRHNFADWGCKVCAFNPGFCVTNLTGPRGREMRIKGGARPARDAGLALAEVVLGKRDEDVEKSGIVDVDGGVKPW